MHKVLAVLILIGVVGGVYYISQTSDVPIPQTDDLIEPFTKSFATGDAITFQIPTAPEPPPKTIESAPVVTVPVTNSTNSTAPPQVDVITQDTSFDKSGAKKQSVYSIDNKMTVTKGNIADIQGDITIVDPLTKQAVEPRFYKYWLTIECSDMTQFCNLEPLTTRGSTDSNGHFQYKWTTHTNTQLGLYSVIIIAQSESADGDGLKYRLEHQMFIEVV